MRSNNTKNIAYEDLWEVKLEELNARFLDAKTPEERKTVLTEIENLKTKLTGREFNDWMRCLFYTSKTRMTDEVYEKLSSLHLAAAIASNEDRNDPAKTNAVNAATQIVRDARIAYEQAKIISDNDFKTATRTTNAVAVVTAFAEAINATLTAMKAADDDSDEELPQLAPI